MDDRVESVGTRDPSPLPFLSIYLVCGVGFWFVLQGGLYVLLAPLAITFVAVPVFDAVMGVEIRNPTESPPGSYAKAIFRLATWLAVPAQAAVLLWGTWTATRPSATPVEIVGLIVAVGIIGGVIGITVAHELVHRASSLDRTLGGVLLTLVFYLHWAIEHVAGHHRRVATREDPATARLGEPLPAFMARSIGLGFLSAWRIESARNVRRGVRSPLRNRVILCVLASSAVAVALGITMGVGALLFFLAQSVVAVAFLETVNYIEHYGLERRLVRPGVYERVTPLHSWNAAHRLTNALLFNLQRHSDHHVWPARPYYKLRNHPDSPQLPMGYAGMALVAMFPPLWRRVMDPRVRAHRARLAKLDAAMAGREEAHDVPTSS
jgi:alkane 1-monooxygenase